VSNKLVHHSTCAYLTSFPATTSNPTSSHVNTLQNEPQQLDLQLDQHGKHVHVQNAAVLIARDARVENTAGIGVRIVGHHPVRGEI